jgi:hypothetical protein
VGKKILLARLNTADDYARAAHFISVGDKREVERVAGGHAKVP